MARKELRTSVRSDMVKRSNKLNVSRVITIWDEIL